MTLILEGVPRIGYGKDEDFTPIGALNAVLRYLGEDSDYPFLMGASGAAFRLSWNPDWSLDSASVCSEDLIMNGSAAYGYRTKKYLDLDLDETWKRIVESISRGFPVLSCGLVGPPEFCIISGYSNDKRLYVRSYFDKGVDLSVVEFKPWEGWLYHGFGKMPLVVLEKGGQRPTEEEVFLESIKRGLRFAKEGKVDRWFSGLEAYRSWANSMAGEIASGLAEKTRVCDLNMYTLIDARRAAASYLGSVMDSHPKWYDPLLGATVHYRKELGALEDARRLIRYPWGEPKEIADKLAEEMVGTARRRRYADHLLAALEEEKRAVAELEKILKEMEEK